MSDAARRWRLVLGADADHEALASTLSQLDQRRDKALGYLFEREHDGRRRRFGAGHRSGGSMDKTALTPVSWLNETRRLFPQSAAETLQKTAIERYGLTELLRDPDVLAKAPANLELVRALLSFRNHLDPRCMNAVRRIIRTVSHELESSLAKRILHQFSGRRCRHRFDGHPSLANVNWHRSIERNLKHFDQKTNRLVVERMVFNPRQRLRIPWEIFLVVDQSGSMADTVIYASIVASVFARVATIRTHLLLFDTSVVDLTEHVSDPLETLLAVQLGGGTDIALAINTVASRISAPHRSIVILVTDFDEGGDVKELVQGVAALRASQCTLLGLTALSDQSNAYLNQQVANQVAAAGMQIATMTPDRLAGWVAEQVLR
ncbi:MAG: VWA domain-containing protein [Pseudomonadota bacterium]